MFFKFKEEFIFGYLMLRTVNEGYLLFDHLVFNTEHGASLNLRHMPYEKRKKSKAVLGEPVSFLGVTFEEGDYLYADSDGVIVSREKLV
jgi:hypothetical protein